MAIESQRPSSPQPPAGWPPLQERRFYWTDPAFLTRKRQNMSGLSFFKAIADGTLPPAPLYNVFGFTLDEVTEGSATLSLQPHEWIYNPLGTVHGGTLATMVDTAAGIATQSALPAGMMSNTVQLSVDFIRAITADTGRLQCRAHIAKPGRQIVLADAELIGEDGKLYGRGSGTFITIPTKNMPDTTGSDTITDDAPPPPPVEQVTHSPEPGFLTSSAKKMSPQTFLESMANGTLPPPTIATTLDFHLDQVDDSTVTFRCTPQGFHYNPLGSVHGGLAATLIDSATGCAVHRILEEGEAYTTVSLTVDFFRPITMAAGPLTCTGQVIRQGRRICVADADLRDANGKIYARGAATCLRFPM